MQPFILGIMMDNIFFNLMEYAVLSSTIRILILFRGVCLICGNENFVKPALDSNDQFGGADVVVFLIFPSKVRGSAPSTPTPATLRTFTDEQTNVSSESCELPFDSSESLSKVENEQRLVVELVLVSFSSNISFSSIVLDVGEETTYGFDMKKNGIAEKLINCVGLVIV